MIRSFWPADVEEIKKIHEKYYGQEFKLPDFYENFLCAFTVVENDKIICSGGVRTIAESIIITNKDFSTRARRLALYEMLQASLFTIGKCGYDELHAFIQDQQWEKHLNKVGFKNTVGKSLVLGLE